MGRSWSRVVSIPLLSLSVVVAACGSSNSSAASYSVQAINLPGPGRVLSDGAGYILYVYIPDAQGSSKCFSGCANAWPPLVLPHGVRHPVAGPGIDDALLGITRRKNGSSQVTYNRWPLYLYIGDGRGQVTGQAEDMGSWYLLSTSGAIDRQPITGPDKN